MKTKFTVVLTLAVLFIVELSFAQERIVSGKVTSADGVPLLGATVVVEGTTRGTSTDFDGNYSIRAISGQVLIFSYVGYQAKRETVLASTDIIDVVLYPGTALTEVVVTALGISREKESLGYSTQEVGGESIASVQVNNFANALSGKVSGLQIRRNNNFGGSTNVVIRGTTSLTGDNQALFVIDGVPVNNRLTNDEEQTQAHGTYYDYGNPAADINPDDIESVNVLKGAAASALYGSRAANGVVFITTKKGARGAGLGITINSGFTTGAMDKSTFAKFQNQYGAGYDGENFTYEDLTGDGKLDQLANYIDDGSYGPIFNPDLLIYQWDAFDPDSPNYMKKTPWVVSKNGADKFFKKPVSFSNSISISNGFDEGSYRISYTKLDQSGLMPKSLLDRHNFMFSGNYDVSDKLNVAASAKYIKSTTIGRNSTGYNDNILGLFRQWWQTNVDIKQQEQIYRHTGRNVSWNPRTSSPRVPPLYWDNPYWTRHENFQNDTRNRLIGRLELNYKLWSWLNIMGRVSTDTYSERQEERRAVGSTSARFGLTRGNVDSGYLRREISVTETNYDLMFNVNKDISERLSFLGLLGTNIRRSELNSVSASTAGGLSVPGLYSLLNGKDALPNPVELAEKVGVNGVFASASFGLDHVVYLDLSIRRDNASTLPKGDNKFYYPSVSTSFVFSRLLKLKAIDFGKLRLNYAEVGNAALFDKLQDSYLVNTDIGTSLSKTSKNPNLKPERTKSYEAGLEMRFLDNRIGFDFAYFQSNSIDQIVELPISNATGYTHRLMNAGEIENKGIEFGLNLVPVRTQDFRWNLDMNFTKAKNKVVKLPEDRKTIQLGSFPGGVTIQAIKGKPYGVLHGTDFMYDDNGNKLINPNNGFYMRTATSNNPIGNTNPDWLMGISNAFSYKGITLSFLIDIQKGGNLFSLDQYYGEATGMYTNSTFINDLGKPVRNSIADGGGFINKGVLPDGSQNTIRVDASEFGAFGYRALPNSHFVYDASYVKLRQANITYDLPSKVLKNTFLTNVQFALTGSNLWIIHKNVPNADPEAGLSAGNLQGYLTGAVPTIREYGLNIKAQF